MKDAKFDFSDDCKKAFNILKEKLTTAPIIISPDWNVPFELMCDASDFAVGSVLGQRIDGKFKPIYYVSKTLNNAQEHYTTTKKELLAVIFSFDKFHPYLVLSKTIVYTDHSALKLENLVAYHLSKTLKTRVRYFMEGEGSADRISSSDEHLMALKTKNNNDEPWTVEITDKNGVSFKVNGQRLKKYHERHIDTEDKEVVEFEKESQAKDDALRTWEAQIDQLRRQEHEDELSYGADSKTYWCEPVHQEHEKGYTLWASYDPYHEVCDGGGIPKENLKHYWKSTNDDDHISLEWEGLSYTNWVRARYDNVIDISKERILQKFWNNKLEGRTQEKTITEEQDDPDKCGETKARAIIGAMINKLPEEWFQGGKKTYAPNGIHVTPHFDECDGGENLWENKEYWESSNDDMRTNLEWQKLSFDNWVKVAFGKNPEVKRQLSRPARLIIMWLLINRIECIAIFALELTLFIFLFGVALSMCYQIRFEERVRSSTVTTQDAIIYSSLIPIPIHPSMEQYFFSSSIHFLMILNDVFTFDKNLSGSIPQISPSSNISSSLSYDSG
ncbi:reverse transcriptase domain-containing protein [Tanacetum coccineum]